jgi:hypothetical protein
MTLGEPFLSRGKPSSSTTLLEERKLTFRTQLPEGLWGSDIFKPVLRRSECGTPTPFLFQQILQCH